MNGTGKPMTGNSVFRGGLVLGIGPAQPYGREEKEEPRPR